MVSPAALAAAAGVRAGSTWARNLFPVVTAWFALVGVSVAAMSATMLARHETGWSVAATVVLGSAAAVFVAVAGWAVLPLRAESPVPPARWESQEVIHALR